MYRCRCAIWILFFYTSVCLGQTVTLSSWKELAPYLEDADASVWVVFDIDLVLIQPASPAFQMAHCGHYPQMIPDILATMPKRQWPLFWNFISLCMEQTLVDPSIPDLLDNLDRRGVPYFAITDTLTGAFADIPSVEARKKQLLLDHGIHLSPPCSESILFSAYPTYRGQHPRFFDGILFTNATSSRKGPLLKSYLDSIQQTPRKLIVVDDLAHNLVSIETALSQADHDPELLLIHFLTTTHLDSQPLSEEMLRMQWEEIRDQTTALF